MLHFILLFGLDLDDNERTKKDTNSYKQPLALTFGTHLIHNASMDSSVLVGP